MNLKKILIIFGIILLVVIGIRLYMYFQFQQMQDYYEQEIISNQEKVEDVNLKVVIFGLRDIVLDWGKKNNSYDGFFENEV
jgi:uncharacterized protein YpmB